jgi:hypothetical protein
LVFFRAEGERVEIDAGGWGTGVVLERLDEVEVGTLTLREAVLAVKLKLSGDNRVLSPAVHVESGLREYEGASIRYRRTFGRRITGIIKNRGGASSDTRFKRVRLVEQARAADHGLKTGLTAEGVERVRESIIGVGIVEWLGAEKLVESLATFKGSAVVYIGIRLYNPDELLARVVEVELDLVRGRTDRLITSELKLLDEVLMRVLGHTTSFIGVKEDVINVKRSSYKRLAVSRGRLRGRGSAGKVRYGPEALINRADVDVNLDLVVLKSN